MLRISRNQTKSAAFRGKQGAPKNIVISYEHVSNLSHLGCDIGHYWNRDI